jgi:hypothetical protein
MWLILFHSIQIWFQIKGSSKSLKVYDPTKASVKLQTSGFQIEDALARRFSFLGSFGTFFVWLDSFS